MGRIRYLGTTEEADEAGATTGLGQTPAPDELFDVAAGRAVYLGRDPGSDVVVHAAGVARAHAMVAMMPRAPDRLVLSDLGTTNGTTVHGERHEVVILAPDEEFVLGGVFRFRFEEREGPKAPAGLDLSAGIRRLMGVMLLVLGALGANLTACSDGWWTDADGRLDMGIISYEDCDDTGCRNQSMGMIYDDGERSERSEVFGFLGGVIYIFLPVIWVLVPLSLFGLYRQGRSQATLWLLGLSLLPLLASAILVGMLPVEMSQVTPHSTRWAPYVYWLSVCAMISACVLLRPKRRESA